MINLGNMDGEFNREGIEALVGQSFRARWKAGKRRCVGTVKIREVSVPGCRCCSGGLPMREIRVTRASGATVVTFTVI